MKSIITKAGLAGCMWGVRGMLDFWERENIVKIKAEAYSWLI